jgi:hypothetical protein
MVVERSEVRDAMRRDQGQLLAGVEVEKCGTS